MKGLKMSCKIVVRMKDIVEKSKSYIKNRTLGAYKTNICIYLDEETNTRCVVGTALSKKQISLIRETADSSLETTISDILSDSVPEQERDDIIELQSLHDIWAQQINPVYKKIKKEEFFKFLREMRKKYGQK